MAFLLVACYLMMRCSLRTGDVPHDWKLANVTAVFKNGKKCSPSNYRPISLTGHCRRSSPAGRVN